MVKEERYITKAIFLVPIFSIILFTLLVFISLAVYFKEFKKEELQEYKNIILQERKKETKDILLSVVQTINHDIKDLDINIKKELKGRILEAQEIINRVLKTNKSQKEKEYLIKEILSAIRYNHNRGYYFAFDKDTKIALIHPIKKFLNKDMSKFKDKRGVNLAQLFIDITKKNGAGYATIYFAKPSNPNKEFKKIVYVKYIPQLNWIIGTGEYVDDALNNLKTELKDEITHQRYGKNGYFWIHSEDYTLLAHPYRQQDIGKNDQNLTDIKGNYIIREFIKKAKENPNGTFISYYWKNPSTNKIEEKISFVYYIPKFKWVIGTGLYTNDLEQILNERTKKTNEEIKEILILIFSLLIIILIIVTFISSLLANHTKKIFESYTKDLSQKIDDAILENRKKDMILQQQSKLAAMGEMISAIAHQWRQPLNSLALNIELLVEDFFDKKVNEDYIEKFEDKQLNTIKFMSKTIDNFRNFFINKPKEKFKVKDAINEVINLVNAQLKNHNIEIEIIGDDFEIEGYKNEFEQVILNLINNSKDSILETKKNGKIKIILKDNQIIIQDNGKEISKEIQNRLFEPYFTTKGVKGTGIGLYMSKMIIEKMGGKLEFIPPKQFVIKGLK